MYYGNVKAVEQLCDRGANIPRDMALTMADEKARTSWLADQKCLATLETGARVKMREFAVIAHGIRVNQVQGTQANGLNRSISSGDHAGSIHKKTLTVWSYGRASDH